MKQNSFARNLPRDELLNFETLENLYFKSYAICNKEIK